MLVIWTPGNWGKINVMPDLALIMGEQPSVPLLEPEQTKNRFQFVFQKFVTVLAQPEHPLVLFLDDWQWADIESLTLLETLMKDPNIKNLLLIGAYRDDEVMASHPALSILASLQKSGISIQTINVSSLSFAAGNEWLAEAMRCSSEAVAPLTTVIYQKTKGLPFFIKAFLQTLYNQDLLTQTKGCWQWDLEKIRQLPATENVITFMIQQIQLLPPEIQETLRFISCLSNRFTLDKVQLITQKNAEQLTSDLQPLLEKGFLLQISDSFQFAHDRIREAVYQQISEQRRAAMHLAIGRSLQSNLPAQPKGCRKFSGHLHRPFHIRKLSRS